MLLYIHQILVFQVMLFSHDRLKSFEWLLEKAILLSVTYYYHTHVMCTAIGLWRPSLTLYMQYIAATKYT